VFKGLIWRRLGTIEILVKIWCTFGDMPISTTNTGAKCLSYFCKQKTENPHFRMTLQNIKNGRGSNLDKPSQSL